MAVDVEQLNAEPEVVRSRRRFGRRGDLPIILVLGGLGFISFVPIIMLLQLSFKDMQQMADAMWLPAWPLHLKNYAKAFLVIKPYLLNSVIFVTGTVAVSIVFSTLSAYALARYPFPGREFFYFAILALLMIPGVLTLITSFVVTVK